jgi:endonuclease/exonuclease/phosphatase family metal-dependent hydrolase
LLKGNTLKAIRYIMIPLIIILAILLLSAGGLLGYLMITEYRPKPVEFLTTSPPRHLTTSPPHHLITCLTWNIGYAGLGKEMDFFYDGGKLVRPAREQSERYLEGISETLAGFDSVDFIFLQEVDIDSKRSYGVNEEGVIQNVLPDHGSAIAVNYDCRFVPVPPAEPMGKVKSGIVTYTRWQPAEATRHAYSANFGWPKRMVFLKRCFLTTRFLLENGKELVMVNLHNSTFDAKGALRLAEMAQLQQFLETEYNKGNYIVTGGDWNMNPRGFAAGSIQCGDRVFDITPPIRSDFLPGWQFAFDPTAPSNRNVDEPYLKGETGTTVIDFFVASPNIEIVATKTILQGFEYSDHNPVLLTFRIK